MEGVIEYYVTFNTNEIDAICITDNTHTRLLPKGGIFMPADAFDVMRAGLEKQGVKVVFRKIVEKEKEAKTVCIDSVIGIVVDNSPNIDYDQYVGLCNSVFALILNHGKWKRSDILNPVSGGEVRSADVKIVDAPMLIGNGKFLYRCKPLFENDMAYVENSLLRTGAMWVKRALHKN